MCCRRLAAAEAHVCAVPADHLHGIAGQVAGRAPLLRGAAAARVRGKTPETFRAGCYLSIGFRSTHTHALSFLYHTSIICDDVLMCLRDPGGRKFFSFFKTRCVFVCACVSLMLCSHGSVYRSYDLAAGASAYLYSYEHKCVCVVFTTKYRDCCSTAISLHLTRQFRRRCASTFRGLKI